MTEYTTCQKHMKTAQWNLIFWRNTTRDIKQLIPWFDKNFQNNDIRESWITLQGLKKERKSN